MRQIREEDIQEQLGVVQCWIEKTIVKGHPDRQYGEYAVGQVLFSPQKSRSGIDLHHSMREVQPDDIILHLTDDNAFTGVSQVKNSYQEVPGIVGTMWGEQPSYLVHLQNFRYLDPPLQRSVFFWPPYREKLLNLLDAGEKDLFYTSEPSLRPDAYLTPAPLQLLTILNDAYQEIAHTSLFAAIEDFLTTEETFERRSSVSATATTLAGSLHEEGDIKEIEPTPASSMSESTLLQHIKDYILAQGYYFPDETIENYHICLKTRPFVILAGLSGTGKSKLPQLYAKAIGHSEHYLRLPVRPNWNDDRYLIGYFDPITQGYMTEPTLDFILQAGEDRNNMYCLCLDEMNLAHVEYYFSQFLSALEEDEPTDRCIKLYSKTIKGLLDTQGATSVPPTVTIPTNLFFVGTINVDETTQPLSDKVMDRANTIDFFEVALDKIPQRRPTVRPVTITTADWHRYKSLETDDSYRSVVLEISKILNTVGLGIGYRVVRDIEQFLANSRAILSPEVAIDLQIKQRILPHIRGTRTIADALSALSTLFERHHFPRSVARIVEMKIRLERDGYVNFWR
jgi:hypothetical protein